MMIRRNLFERSTRSHRLRLLAWCSRFINMTSAVRYGRTISTILIVGGITLASTAIVKGFVVTPSLDTAGDGRSAHLGHRSSHPLLQIEPTTEYGSVDRVIATESYTESHDEQQLPEAMMRDRTMMATWPHPRQGLDPGTASDFLLQEDATTLPSATRLSMMRASIPTHIAIPAVGIDTTVVEVEASPIEIDGRLTFEWQVADWAAGHHNTSARPGETGNIVIAGHDDVRGEVFRGLHDIAVGDEIILTSSADTFHYSVEEIHLRLYEGASIEDQVAIGGFAGPMPEERLTLITCWPYHIDTHRLIIVAKPVSTPVER